MKQIADFFALYKCFAWEKDTPNMINLYDENVVVFDMWQDGYCVGLTQWKRVIAQWLGSLKDERVNVDFEMINIQNDAAIGFASAVIRYQAMATDGTVIRSMKNRITIGFAKTENDWKVIHQHTSAPIDSNLQAILDI